MNKYQQSLDYIESILLDEDVLRIFDSPNYPPLIKYHIKNIQKLVDTTKYPIKPTKTKKHSWRKDECGDIDIFGYTDGEYCNGPVCEICGYGFCHHCHNHYNDETCNEHYICKCGQHLKGTEKTLSEL